jgi:hypothetical protein
VRQSDQKITAANISRTADSSGRVKHDERGVAVWDWASDSDVIDALTASAVMRRLDVAELKLQDAPGLSLSIAGRDAGGGGDPYNSRCSERRAAPPSRTRDR